jgi:hypothetical protein
MFVFMLYMLYYFCVYIMLVYIHRHGTALFPANICVLCICVHVETCFHSFGMMGRADVLVLVSWSPEAFTHPQIKLDPKLSLMLYNPLIPWAFGLLWLSIEHLQSLMV